jgi:hypothetical protein
VQATTGAAAASAAASDLVSSLWSSLRQRWNRNAEAALESGAETAGMDVDGLLEELTSTPVRQELLASALEGAAHATLEAKIKALGRSLATGALATNSAEVDRELLFVRAMSEIEAPHLRLLEQMAKAKQALYRAQLPEVTGLGSAFDPLFATLQRHGLVQQVAVEPRSGVYRWELTRFGHDCLGRLRVAGEPELEADAQANQDEEP